MISATDIVAADLCSRIYQLPGDKPVAWSWYDDGSDDGLCHGVVKIDGLWYWCFRGSVTAQDWFDDFEAAAVYDTILHAHVHPGFNRGVMRAWDRVKSIVDGPWVACGHSLGAARADNAAAYAVLEKRAPTRRVVFGEPKPGFADFASLVAQAPGASYRNKNQQGHDVVPDVPVRLLVERYQAPSPLVDVAPVPAPGGGLDPFAYHHMPLYLGALRSSA